MPRAKANSDPLVVTHERSDMPGRPFLITATRMGAYSVTWDGRAMPFARAAQPVLYPSNKLQAEAVEAARNQIDAALPDRFA